MLGGSLCCSLKAQGFRIEQGICCCAGSTSRWQCETSD